MEDPSADGLLRAGGDTGAEGATGGAEPSGLGAGAGEGEAATATANRITSSSQLPLKKQFRTPQAIRSNVQVENSQHEAETDSTASSPQPPLPRGRGHSALPQPIDGPSTNKVRKPVKIKRRTSSRTTSDVWEYFTQEDTEDGPVAVCVFCDQVYQCDRSYHGTSTLRSHLLYRCPSCPFTDHERRRKMPSPDDHKFSAEDCRRALAKMIIV